MNPISDENEEKAVVKKSERAALRPEARAERSEDDSRARAVKRAAELRQHVTSFDEGVDKFTVPNPPDGWTYEWKRRTVMGWEDPSYINSLQRMGWEPVPVTRHPEMMPKGHVGTIEREGQILMERPKEITDEIRGIELRKAREQVNIKAGQMDPKGKGGIISRDDAQVAPKIKKGYEPMMVPD
jgi:hypothetical protein